jgi:3-oxoacyl-[acyl-carrier protein] reductase
MSGAKAPPPVYPDLAGKVALVTGSSRGIGAETARRLAANKVKVVINGRQAEGVERMVAEINACGGAAVGCVADCSKADQLETMRRQIEAQLGAVSLLFAFVREATVTQSRSSNSPKIDGMP